MMHHDARPYDVAASAAARHGRLKMEKIIADGQASAEAVVSRIQNHTPRDVVVAAPSLRLKVSDSGSLVMARQDGYAVEELGGLHTHAYGQLLQDAGLPKRTADEWMKVESRGKPWGTELVAHAVNEVLAHREKQRNLIRLDDDAGGVVKGFLSDKFRRLDSRPLADAFMGMCTGIGLVPIEGVASDTKCRIRAVLPRVFEPVDNEVMIFGLEFGNSDYGDGGVVVNMWMMRVACTNLAVVQKGLRQVHLGGRLPDDLQLSAATYASDAKTVALALADVGNSLIGPDPVHRMLNAVKDASEKTLTEQGIDGLLKGLDKGEAATIKTVYNSPDDLNLPPGESVYRLSNAVSFFAQSRGLDPNRRIQLQELAGAMMVPAATKDKAKEV